MAFDETGQADTVERKVAILGRAYDLLTQQAGFQPEDIVLDPNILAVATGMQEHDHYGLWFLQSVPLLKQRCPGALVSGGVSNLSFAFRGNDVVREAMHAAFLYHAIHAGQDMGIVNAGRLPVYDDIPADLLERVEDVVLARRTDATERMLTFAETVRGENGTRREDDSCVARGAGSRAALVRAGARDRLFRRAGRRGGPRVGRAAARRDRGAADGRDEDRRRHVR